MGNTEKALVALLAGYVLVYILPLGVRPLAIPDETRYAEIPREMLETGDFVVPRLNGLRYFEKPVLGYWAIAASIAAFGENAFAVRLPFALAAGLTALLCFVLVSKYGGGFRPAFISATALLSSFLVFALGIYAVLDGVFALLIAGALTSFFFAYMAPEMKRRIMYLALSGISCGLAFLAKGFLAFVLPAVVIVPFLLWQRRWRDLFTMPWIPLIVAVLIALPWGIAVHVREGDYWHEFFWMEHIARFTNPGKARHLEPFWYYLPVLVGGSLPWTAVAPAAFLGLRVTRFREPLVRYSICSFVFPFLFFTLSRGKLGTYLLPCFGPLMTLTGIGLWTYTQTGRTKALSIGAAASAIVAAVLLFGILFVPPSHLVDEGFLSSVHYWKWGAVIALAAWMLFSRAALKASDPMRRVCLFALSPALLMFGLHFASTSYDCGKVPGRFLMARASRVGKETILVSNYAFAPAIAWYYKRSDVHILDSSGELSYGLGYPDAKSRFLGFDGLARLVETSNEPRHVVLILRTKRYASRKAQLPKPKHEEVGDEYVFVEY